MRTHEIRELSKIFMRTRKSKGRMLVLARIYKLADDGASLTCGVPGGDRGSSTHASLRIRPSHAAPTECVQRVLISPSFSSSDIQSAAI